MNSFAIFRLPHADSCMMIEGEAVVLPSLAELGDQQGFLLAPFMASEEEPIVLLRGEGQEVRGERLPQLRNISLTPHILPLTPHPSAISHQPSPLTSHLSPLTSRNTYASDFSTFHRALLNGEFQKLVLARCATIANEGKMTPMELFQKACQRYPRMFVALVSTPQSGTWLTASPEILLENLPDSRWRTIALAGTMRLRTDKADDEGQRLRWSAKNIQEQRYVASYLADVLRRFSDDVREEGPRTVRAAHLVHLRSDFTFTLSNNKCTRVGELLEILHPTPAVCGLPKAEAQRFIIAHEHAPRHYYSGFMGPLNLPLTSHHSPLTTHLYVSLRCMHITSDTYHLYAGGGLLRESTEQQEWQETEAKLDTMRHVLQ